MLKEFQSYYAPQLLRPYWERESCLYLFQLKLLGGATQGRR
jgi:hypothetical protein